LDTFGAQVSSDHERYPADVKCLGFLYLYVGRYPRNNASRNTLHINLLAPFFWTQAFLPELAASRGSVINIGSIHARLTKQRFAAYATSKAALTGLTRSLALELGNRVRVNAIEPAAIDTAMLRAGFEGDREGFSRLAQCHPTQCIGKPEEVARLAVMLADEGLGFLNGAVVPLDGGIGGRLYEGGNT
ncbi:MAG: Enoyl-(Acyl carrier protein) reductase, partial [Candidatus Kentron sp. G]